jgi:hypothetical protein
VFQRCIPVIGLAGRSAVVPFAIAKAPVTLSISTMPLVAWNSSVPLLSADVVIPVTPETAPLSALMIDVMFFSF